MCQSEGQSRGGLGCQAQNHNKNGRIPGRPERQTVVAYLTHGANPLFVAAFFPAAPHGGAPPLSRHENGLPTTSRHSISNPFRTQGRLKSPEEARAGLGAAPAVQPAGPVEAVLGQRGSGKVLTTALPDGIVSIRELRGNAAGGEMGNVG